MARRRQENVKDKRTPIKIRPIQRKASGKITEPWAILERLLAEVSTFSPIRNCRVRLYWQKDWKQDVDGIAVGAMACKASELDRNLVEESGGETPDIFIKLPEKQWPQLDDKEKERRIFHELLHIHPAKDSNGGQKSDSKDRPLWRLGRHPIATFHEEIARYGAEMVIGSNQRVLDAMRASDQPLLAHAEKEAAAADGEAKTPVKPPLAAGDWEGIDVAEVPDMPAAALRAFNTKEIVTLKDLTDWQAKKGDFWAKDLPGVGSACEEKIAAAMEAFWASRKTE